MRLSPGESKLLRIIQRHSEPVSTTNLVRMFYGRETPEYAQVVISGLVRSLERKTATEEVRVRRSKRAGSRPMMVWSERRAA